METDRLRQFAVLAETAHFRKASELLGISHSGLSKSMRALEDEMGVSLFVKQGRGVVVTDAGRRLAERCGPFFEELGRLIGDGDGDVDVNGARDGAAGSARVAPKERPFRLGAFEVFSSAFLGVLVRDEFGERPLEVFDLAPGRLEEALLLDRIEAGITYEPVPRAGIEYVRVGRVSVGLFRRRGAFENVPLGRIPFIAPIAPLEGVPTGVRGSDAWSETRLLRTIRYRVDSLTTGLELMGQGLGAIFIPRFVAELFNANARRERRCEEVALPRGTPAVFREVFLVRRQSTPEGPEWKKIARAVRKLG